jgi:endonuclease/exonuclease/phosphatase family metal-dependent hydrolase
MTRNLYVGVDLFRLATASDLDDVRRVAGRLLADVRAHPYAARADAIAAEVEASAPDVLGVQEAALVRTREPSEWDGEHDPGASDVVVDLLALLVEALEARGLSYEVAASTVTNDVEVPADVDDREVDVRLTDRLAVLVREGVDVDDARTGRFEADFPVPLEETDLSIKRGFCRVDLTVGDEAVTAATTHLEAVDPGVRRAQARELLDRLPSDRPVVLAGDVNSGPGGGSDAYDLLVESFADPLEIRRSDANAYTCCYDADLRGEAADLTRRVDVVLHRGRLRPTDVHLVGTDPDSRVTTEVAGETVRLWPSDHAGVVTTFEFRTPGSSVTPTAAPTDAAPTPDAEQPEPQSGMGFIAAAVGAAVAAILRARKRG